MNSVRLQQTTGGFLWRFFLVLCGALLVLSFASPLYPLTFLVLTLYALRGPREVVQALALLSVLLLLNPALVQPEGGKALRWLVLFAAFGRILWDSIFQGAAVPRQLLGLLLLFVGTVIALALLTSYAPLISVLKAISFALGSATILIAFHRTRHLRAYWEAWFTTLFLFIIGTSLPLYFSRAGYTVAGSSFQGILNHPQAFGPVMAAAAVWLTMRYLFAADKSPLSLLPAAAAWFGVYATNSRTALLIAGGGMLITLAIGYVRGHSWRPDFRGAFPVTGVLIAVLATSVLVVWRGDQLQQRATDFLLKDDAGLSYAEAFQSSRGFLIDRQWENFKSAPIAGIGFGVPSDPTELNVKRGGPLNLPVGASVEKGFMPSAVLEELGITGAILVVLLIGTLIRAVYKEGSAPVFALLVACLLVNLGEMVFLSVGGMGLFFWVLMGLTYNLSTPADPTVPWADGSGMMDGAMPYGAAMRPRRYRRVTNKAPTHSAYR